MGSILYRIKQGNAFAPPASWRACRPQSAAGHPAARSFQVMSLPASELLMAEEDFEIGLRTSQCQRQKARATLVQNKRFSTLLSSLWQLTLESSS